MDYYSTIYGNSYFADRSEEYLLKMEATDELKNNVQSYMDNFYNEMFSSINNNSDFNIIDSLEEEKDDYNKLLNNKEKIGSYSDTIYSDFRLNRVNLTDVYYFGDSSIIVKYELEYTYHYKFTYTNFMASMTSFNEDKDESKTLTGTIQLEKNGNSFIVKTGYSLIPNI